MADRGSPTAFLYPISPTAFLYPIFFIMCAPLPGVTWDSSRTVVVIKLRRASALENVTIAVTRTEHEKHDYRQLCNSPSLSLGP